MPDLQSELSKIATLRFDDDEDQTPLINEKKLTVAEQVYNIIEYNQPVTSQRIAQLAVETGIKYGSVTSTVTQLAQRGMVQFAHDGQGNRVYSTAKPYTVGGPPRRPVTKVTTPPKKPAQPDDISSILNSLNIYQARDLYNALHEFFERS